MSAKVIPLRNVTWLDLPADRVLEGAIGRMRGVVLMGYDNDGELYFASSFADGGEILWLAEVMKKKLLEIADDRPD